MTLRARLIARRARASRLSLPGFAAEAAATSAYKPWAGTSRDEIRMHSQSGQQNRWGHFPACSLGGYVPCDSKLPTNGGLSHLAMKFGCRPELSKKVLGAFSGLFARRICPVRQQVAYKRYTVTSGDEVCGPELSNKLLGPFSGLFARRVCPVRQQVAHQRWRIASGDVIWLRDKVGQKIAWGSFPACVCQRTCPLSMEWAGPDATPPA